MPWDTATVEAFDAIAAQVSPEAVRRPVLVSADLGQHSSWLGASLSDIGFDDLYLHHVGQDQEAFIDAFGEHVLPDLVGAPR